MEPVLILTHGDVTALQGAIDKLKEEGFEATVLNTATATFTDILAGLAGKGDDEEKDEKEDEKEEGDEEGKDKKEKKDKEEKPADGATDSPDAELDATEPPPDEEVPEGAVVHGETVGLRIFEGHGIELHSPQVRKAYAGAAQHTDVTINESVLRSWSAQDAQHKMLVSVKGGKASMVSVTVVEDTGSATYLRVGRETMKMF